MKPNIEIYNQDCMIAMSKMKDNEFDLAIVDPPYGIKVGKQSLGLGGGFTKHVKKKPYKMGNWDNAVPTKEYFKELFRVSKNQVIWGGNYFDLPPTPCYIFWDKNNGTSDFADGELAWTSFKSPVRMIRFTWAGCFQGDMKNKEVRIHPTHKPIYVYKYILENYAKKGDKILDTHLGGGSIAIACHDYGFDLTACELDKEYFDLAMKRLKIHQSQLRMNL